MKDIEIQLRFEKAHFYELFREEYRRLYLGKGMKIFFANFLIVASLLSLSYVIEPLQNYQPVILIFLVVFSLVLLGWIYNSVQYYFKIKSYIDGIDRNVDRKIVLTNTYFKFCEDETVDIVRWSAFNCVYVQRYHLMLIGYSQYTFPEKSMDPDDYILLNALVLEKIK